MLASFYSSPLLLDGSAEIFLKFQSYIRSIFLSLWFYEAGFKDPVQICCDTAEAMFMQRLSTRSH